MILLLKKQMATTIGCDAVLRVGETSAQSYDALILVSPNNLILSIESLS